MTKYRVVTYNGNTEDFTETVFAYELKDAIHLLKIKCYGIIDDFAHDGIRMSIIRHRKSNAIRIDGIDDGLCNYYVVFLKEESYYDVMMTILNKNED